MSVPLKARLRNDAGVGLRDITVEAINMGTGLVVDSTTTDADGLFSFAALPDAVYSLRATVGSHVLYIDGDSAVQYSSINLAQDITISAAVPNHRWSLSAGRFVAPSGTAFPTNPAPVDGEIFNRTDEDVFYQYEGSSASWIMLSGAPVGSVQMFAGAAAPNGWLLCQGQEVLRSTYARLFAAIGTTWGAGNGSTTFVLPDLRGRAPIGASPSHGLASTGGEETHTLSEAEMPAHSHTLTDPGHTHTQNAHTHVQDAHNHTQNAHSHTVLPTDTYGSVQGGTGVVVNGVGMYEGSTPTNTSSVTATNNAATATNQAATATEQAATTGVTVQTKGSGSAHNIMQPFAAVQFIIKY